MLQLTNFTFISLIQPYCGSNSVNCVVCEYSVLDVKKVFVTHLRFIFHEIQIYTQLTYLLNSLHHSFNLP